MERTTAGFWLALVALAWVPRPAAAACAQAEVRLDRAAHAIDWTVTLPPGVTRVALPDLSPYSRKALWQSPDGSARVEENAIVATDPARPELHLRMDVRQQARYEDRAYPPYARFDDGTVVVYTTQFEAEAGHGVALCTRYLPAAGEQVIGYGRAQATPLRPDPARPDGYVAFGRPRVERHGSLLLVSDHGVPAWIRERVAAQVPALGDYYTRRLGPAVIPTIFLYVWPQAPGVRNYKGDHLPSSLTLALMGRGWDDADPDTLRALVGFLAHELFHSWNTARAVGSPEGEALLAKEGGAELARILATAAVLHEPRQEGLDAISHAYNACLFELPAGKSIARLLDASQPGPLPYDCGVPLMYALAVAVDARDPAAGYFGQWRRLEQAHQRSGRPGYAWQDLMPRTIDAKLRDALLGAVARPDAFAAGMAEAWRRLGVRTAPEAAPDEDARRRYAGQLMASLMAQDCGGMISFYNNPDGIVLDQPLPRCKSLLAGRTVTHLLGQPLATADLRALGEAIGKRCIAGQPVPVGYAPVAGQPQQTPLACRRPPPALPPLLRLLAPRRSATPDASPTMRR